jgi:hypothetical protein
MSVVILLLAACTPSGPGVPVTGDTSVPNTPSPFPELPPEVVLEAQQWLATQLNVAGAENRGGGADRMTDSAWGWDERTKAVFRPSHRVGEQYSKSMDSAMKSGPTRPVPPSVWHLLKGRRAPHWKILPGTSYLLVRRTSTVHSLKDQQLR